MRDKSTEEGLLSRAAAGPPDLHAGRDRAGAVRTVRDAPHARVRHDPRDARVGRGEEPLQRRARSVRALPERDHDRRRARSRRRCAHPLHLLDCCPQTDGAAAVLLVPAERAHEFTDKPVYVAGFGVATDHPYLHEKDSFVEIKATVLASQRAYAMAGVGPARHRHAPRCTTASRSPRSSTSRTSASSRRARAASRRSKARPSLTGRIPVNTSGGLLAKGHPIGATGVAQITECWWQLRGEAERAPGRDPQRLRAAAQRRRPRLRRVRRQHPHQPSVSVTRDDGLASRRDADGVVRHHARPARGEERARRSRCATASSTRCATSAPTRRCASFLITGDGRRVLRGHGPHRVDGRAGGQARASTRARPPRRCASGVQTFIRELWELDKPTVAAVNGAAVGPGAHLALACDFVFVQPDDPVHVVVRQVGPRRRRRRRVPAPPPRRPAPGQGDGDARRGRNGRGGRRPRARVPVRRHAGRAGRRGARARRRSSRPGRPGRSGCRSGCSTRRSRPTCRRCSSSRALPVARHRRRPISSKGMAAFREKRDAKFTGT